MSYFPTETWVALGLAALAIGILTYLVISPGATRLSLSRRRPGAAPDVSLLTRATGAVTKVIDRFLSRQGNADTTTALLELAGIRMRPQDFFLILLAAMMTAAAVGVLVGGLVLALVLVVLVPVITKVVISIMTSRRQRAFDGQIHDAMQAMAGNLRAGHSLLQALASVAEEAPAPLSEEFARVVNEARVGRDVGVALEETARRMDSKDMTWVAQAISINRQTGGNLAEVLDQVGATIRERGQIKRQVAALSAEGKLSAYVLMVLPFGVGAFIMFTNPGYLHKFVENVLGYGLIGISVVLLVVGGLWLRKAVTIKF